MQFIFVYLHILIVSIDAFAREKRPPLGQTGPSTSIQHNMENGFSLFTFKQKAKRCEAFDNYIPISVCVVKIMKDFF